MMELHDDEPPFFQHRMHHRDSSRPASSYKLGYLQDMPHVTYEEKASDDKDGL